MKSKFYKASFLLLLSVLLLFIVNTFIGSATDGTKIVFFGMGDADSIYIENHNQTILIDAGLKSDRKKLISKLKSLGVTNLDYVILTHPDKDHIGGASYVLDEFEVGELIQSVHFKDTKREARIAEVVEEKNIKNTILTEDCPIDLGELKVTIMSPEKSVYQTDNDYSLITLVEDGDLNYLFAGDAEADLTKELLERDFPPIDMYKVAHHGRKNEYSKAFIEKIAPQYAVITNSPTDDDVKDFLEAENAVVRYVYDRDLHFFSNGTKMRMK